MFQFFSVKLEGYQEKKTFSFVEAPKNFTQNPTLAPVNCLLELIEFSALDITSIESDLEMLFWKRTSLIAHLNDQMLFFYSQIYEFTNYIFKRSPTEDRKTEGGKKKVLGKIDVVAGRLINGKKPSITDSNTVLFGINI